MKISPKLQKAAYQSLGKLQKHSPTILISAGVGAVLVGGFLAAKNTLKLEQTLEDGVVRTAQTKSMIEEGVAKPSAQTKVYVRNAVEVGKLYALPVTLTLGGLVCILSSHRILTKRNAALAVAYNGLAASYEAYRERVREEYGEEKERDIFFGERTEVVEDDKGKKTKVKRLVDGEHTASPYRFIYDAHNDNWTGFHDDNIFRLTTAQNMFNDQLRRKGHVFLRDILIVLGIEPTPASVVTGWVFDENDPNHIGDNFIEFNIRDYQSEHGYILLDFNVDGTILDKM